MQSRIDHKTRHCIAFLATSDQPITEDMATEEQERLGYNPMGYGFFGFYEEPDGDTHTAYWYCHSTCD